MREIERTPGVNSRNALAVVATIVLLLAGLIVPGVAPTPSAQAQAPQEPTVTPGAGFYTAPHTVFLSEPGGATIFYRTDGQPIESGSPGTLYNDPIILPAGTYAIVALAVAGAEVSGQVSVSPIVVSDPPPVVETPVITPGGGEYNERHDVTITTATPDAEIYYRTDGLAVTFFAPGVLYTGPFILTAGAYNISAIATLAGYTDSDNAFSGAVTVNPTVLPAPVFFPEGGEFAAGGDVTVFLGSTVLGRTMRYTIDGSEPDESSTEYTGPIALNETAGSTITVKARIYLEGYTVSPVTAFDFSFVEACNGEIATVVVGVFGVATEDRDVIVGTEGADRIRGLAGDDLICGLGGDDWILGGSGSDVVFGEAGDDEIRGGGGADLLDGGPGDDDIVGQAGLDTIYGRAGQDRLEGQGASDTIFGGDDDDVVKGQQGGDALSGGDGNDVVTGQTGPDIIEGQAGDDNLGGGNGNDVLYGGPGTDKCAGNTGPADQAHAATCESIPGIEVLF